LRSLPALLVLPDLLVITSIVVGTTRETPSVQAGTGITRMSRDREGKGYRAANPEGI